MFNGNVLFFAWLCERAGIIDLLSFPLQPQSA